MSHAFELCDLVKRYGRSVEALRGVSLTGEKGEILGLLGPNGAGKTTSVKCLTGLVRPTSGRALIGGNDASIPSARARLGYMPERPRYPADLTALELLDREGRVFSVPRAKRRARIAALVERVALHEEVARRRVHSYSKGERARLGIALALMGDPEVVLLDEPTDGLDPLGRKAVRDLLTQLRDEGRAVLLNSHLLSEVESCCDRVAILKQGRMLAQGTPADLLAGRRVVYTVRLAEEPTAEVLESVEGAVETLRVEGAVLTVTLAKASGIDPVVDALRALGTSIRELGPQASLEDVFVELVTGGAGGAEAPVDVSPTNSDTSQVDPPGEEPA